MSQASRAIGIRHRVTHPRPVVDRRRHRRARGDRRGRGADPRRSARPGRLTPARRSAPCRTTFAPSTPATTRRPTATSRPRQGRRRLGERVSAGVPMYGPGYDPSSQRVIFEGRTGSGDRVILQLTIEELGRWRGAGLPLAAQDPHGSRVRRMAHRPAAHPAGSRPVAVRTRPSEEEIPWPPPAASTSTSSPGSAWAVLLVGVSLLLEVLLSALGLGSGESLYGGGVGNRQQLTLGAALVAVGLPGLAHPLDASLSAVCVLAARMRTSSGARRCAACTWRRCWPSSWPWPRPGRPSCSQDLIYALGGRARGVSATPPALLAGLVVAAVAWLYHLAVRLADWRRGPIHDAGAWLPRLYLYGAAGVSLLGAPGVALAAWSDWRSGRSSAPSAVYVDGARGGSLPSPRVSPALRWPGRSGSATGGMPGASSPTRASAWLPSGRPDCGSRTSRASTWCWPGRSLVELTGLLQTLLQRALGVDARRGRRAGGGTLGAAGWRRSVRRGMVAAPWLAGGRYPRRHGPSDRGRVDDGRASRRVRPRAPGPGVRGRWRGVAHRAGQSRRRSGAAPSSGDPTSCARSSRSRPRPWCWARSSGCGRGRRRRVAGDANRYCRGRLRGSPRRAPGRAGRERGGGHRRVRVPLLPPLRLALRRRAVERRRERRQPAGGGRARLGRGGRGARPRHPSGPGDPRVRRAVSGTRAGGARGDGGCAGTAGRRRIGRAAGSAGQPRDPSWRRSTRCAASCRRGTFSRCGSSVA